MLRHPRLATLVVLALGLVLAGALGEGFARVAGPRFAQGPWSAEYHALLGFVPEPGSRARPAAAWRVNIDAEGLRSNGGPPPPGVPILATGDSYTFGEEMNDDETWPACLERDLQVPVRNGGVSAYGFDQTVLRTELLLRERRVRGVIVSVIHDDLRRCQCSRLSGWPKAWFDVRGGRLELRNSPVPRPLFTRPWLGALAQHSRLLAWLRSASSPLERVEHARGREVALLLIDRLGEQARRGPPLLLLVQGPLAPARGRWPRFEQRTLPALRELAERAERNGIPALNLVEDAWREVRQRPALRRKWYIHETGGHMTAAGNAWAAARVAAKLRELGWVNAHAGAAGPVAPSSQVGHARPGQASPSGRRP